MNGDSYRKRKTCLRKVRFSSGIKAVRILEDWVKHRRTLNLYDFHVYPCQFCEGWHIGSPEYREEWKGGPSGLVTLPGQLVVFRRSREGKTYIGWNDINFHAIANPDETWRPKSKKRKEVTE